MKSLLFTFLINILLLPITCAQITQQADHTYALPATKKVIFDLPFARKITVKTWDKQEVLFKTSIKAENEEVAKIHEMTVNEGSDALRIKTDYADTKDKHRNFCGCEENQHKGSWNCLCLEVNYDIYLPVNAVLKMETINGNIEVRGMEGDIHLETINGFIDIAYNIGTKTDINFSTINGEIYTDFDINKKGNLRKFSKDIKTQLNGGGPELALETINGDIYFRKAQ